MSVAELMALPFDASTNGVRAVSASATTGMTSFHRSGKRLRPAPATSAAGTSLATWLPRPWTRECSYEVFARVARAILSRLMMPSSPVRSRPRRYTSRTP